MLPVLIQYSSFAGIKQRAVLQRSYASLYHIKCFCPGAKGCPSGFGNILEGLFDFFLIDGIKVPGVACPSMEGHRIFGCCHGDQ